MSQIRRFSINDFEQFEDLTLNITNSREVRLDYEGTNISYYFRETSERTAIMALHMLDVNSHIKDLILSGSIDEYPSRSERDWLIYMALLRKHYDFETIKTIFSNRFYGCSNRIREKGNDFLAKEICRALAKIEQEKENDAAESRTTPQSRNLGNNVFLEEGIRPNLISLDSVEPRPVKWLWKNRIPQGKITLIIGDPGDGKSYLTIYIAAQITAGGTWPDSEIPISTGSVIILTAEDGLADTVRTRADASGADVEKIKILDGITKRNGGQDFFNLLEYLPALEQAIIATENVRLVIIDPIPAYLGRIDSHNTSMVRGALAPLASLAEKYEIAIVAITHLNKNEAFKAIYRATGSLAFIAAARAVWAVTRDNNDETRTRRFLLPIKANLSINPDSLAFRITNNGIIFENRPLEINPEEALSSERREETSTLNHAVNWLREALENGPIPSVDIFRMAQENRISDATLRRAKTRLGVKSDKEGIAQNGRWLWKLPRE